MSSTKRFKIALLFLHLSKLLLANLECNCGPDRFCDSLYQFCQSCDLCKGESRVPDVNCNQCTEDFTEENTTDNDLNLDVNGLKNSWNGTVVAALMIVCVVLDVGIIVLIVIFRNKRVDKNPQKSLQWI